MMEALGHQILTELFKTDTQKAIEIAEHLIVNQPNIDFETWIEEEKKRVTEFSCHESWESSHIVVVCQTCAIGKNSGICVPCYLKGNHEGHSLLIDISNSGACDCGNSSCWNTNGFCQKHTHEGPDNPHLIDLGEKRSDFIGSIVLSAISALIPLSLHQKTLDNVELICKFLISLATIGDAYRRIISLVFVDDYDFNDLLINWPRFTFEAANSIFKLLSELINDTVFINRFTTYFCDSFTYLVGVKVNTAFHEEGYVETEIYFDETLPVDIILDISFYTWSYLSSHPSLFEFNNIPDLISRTLTIYTSLMAYNQRHQIVSSECMRSLLEYLGILINTDYFLNLLSDPENQEILSSFLRSISLIEANPIVEITNNPKSFNLKNYCQTHHLLYTAFKPLVKVNVDSTVFFSVLSFYVLMNLIRDLVDHPADPSSSIWQRSVFSRGICLGCFLPLHFLSFEHFIMHTNDPLHDWEAIASSQNMESEILLFGTTILPIRTCAVASYISFGISPAPKAVNANLNHEQAIRGRFSAAYCAAALLSEPDDFVLMVMHTFGLFDDPEFMVHNSFITRRFTFFHFLTVLIFDNSIFERTYHGILRSQTISLLQYGSMSISSILEALQTYDENIDFSYELKDILDEIAYKIKPKDIPNDESKYYYTNDFDDKTKNKSPRNHHDDSQPKFKLPPLPKPHKKSNSMINPFLSNHFSSSSSTSSSSSLFDSDVPDFSLTPPPPNLYKLKPRYKSVAPFNIWTSPCFSYQYLRAIIDPESSSLIDLKLHKGKPFPNGFETNRILFTQCFFTVCYLTALEIDYKTDYTTIHLMLNLLLYVDKLNDEPPCKDFLALIKVQTYKQMCMIMPTSFQRFLRTPFQYKYNNASTFLDLVRHFGSVGASFINSITKGNNNSSNPTNKKKIADSTKLMEINEINRQIVDYCPKIVKIELHQQCAICHKATKVTELIPALLYRFKMMPSGRITWRVTLDGSIFHSKCFFESKESMVYFNFVLNDTNSVFKAFESNLVKLIQTIADEVEIIEIRLSRNPFIFRDSAPSLKLGYLFETARVNAKKERTSSKNNKGNKPNPNTALPQFRVETDFLSKLISDISFAKSAKDCFFDIFSNNYNKEYKNNDIKIEFSMLRRCILVACHISHVISLKQTEEIINNYEKLCDFFKINNENANSANNNNQVNNDNNNNNNETESTGSSKKKTSGNDKLQNKNKEESKIENNNPATENENVITEDTNNNNDNNKNTNNVNLDEDYVPSFYYPFISLPKNFLELSAEPFSFDILNLNPNVTHLYLCLVTGKCIDTNEVFSHLKEVCYTIFLILTGSMAGSVCVMLDGHPELTKTVDSPYVTIFGEEQCGMKDGQMLWYNEDRMWRLCDQFLDGTLLLP